MIETLKINLEDLFRENEKLEGEKAALSNQAEDMRKAKGEIETELVNVRSQLARSQESSLERQLKFTTDDN